MADLPRSVALIGAGPLGLELAQAQAAGGRLLGATMVGPGVEHSAHLIAWAIQQQMTAAEVLDLPFYHPTYEEGLKPALQSICDTVHAPSNIGKSMAPGA